MVYHTGLTADSYDVIYLTEVKAIKHPTSLQRACEHC